jgi:hypothetical protein
VQQLDIATIAVGLEISLLLLVILGRWFLPKGNISRSALSQLLLVYMSLASDIVDLLSLLNETQVQESMTMTCFTLAIFSWSLFQFSLNLVVTRGRSFQSTMSNDFDTQDEMDEDAENDQPVDEEKRFIDVLNKFASDTKNSMNKKKKRSCGSDFFQFEAIDSEVWSILITLIFQDGPFLVLRLTAVIEFNVRTFVTMFFTFKNGIILFLQIYRLTAICSEAKQNQMDPLNHNKADAIASLQSAASFLDKYVLLSFTQNYLTKNNTNNNSVVNRFSAIKKKSVQNNKVIEECERKLGFMNPILIRSALTKAHTYAVVLTPTCNLAATCCQCECHVKGGMNTFG